MFSEDICRLHSLKGKFLSNTYFYMTTDKQNKKPQTSNIHIQCREKKAVRNVNK